MAMWWKRNTDAKTKNAKNQSQSTGTTHWTTSTECDKLFCDMVSWIRTAKFKARLDITRRMGQDETGDETCWFHTLIREDRVERKWTAHLVSKKRWVFCPNHVYGLTSWISLLAIVASILASLPKNWKVIATWRLFWICLHVPCSKYDCPDKSILML